MSQNSKIQWTERTWQVTVGCTHASTGCRACYAEKMAYRLRKMAEADIAAGRDPGRKRHYIDAIGDNGKWTGKLVQVPEALDDPLRWKKPQRVFVDSMSDLFHKSVPFEFIHRVWDVMWSTPQHTYQVLTKRADRAAKYFMEHAGRREFNWTDIGRTPHVPGGFVHYDDFSGRNQCGYVGDGEWVCDHPKNESKGCVDSCSPCDCPLAYRVCDRESLTKIDVADDHEFDDEGYTDDSDWMELHSRPLHAMAGNVWLGFSAENQRQLEKRIRAFRPIRWHTPYQVLFGSLEPLLGPLDFTIPYWKESEEANYESLTPHEFRSGGDMMRVPFLNWLIIGCESGPNRRPMELDWARRIIEQARAAGVAVFVKQIPIKGKVSHDPSEWPSDLQVREYPEPPKIEPRPEVSSAAR